MTKAPINIWFWIAALFILGITYLTTINDMLYGHNSVYLTRNAYRYDSYLNRDTCFSDLFFGGENNSRILYTSSHLHVLPYISNWKSLMELELHKLKPWSVLFSYRELDLPFTGLLHGSFSGQWSPANYHPPRSHQVASNVDLMRLMGVRYIVSADEMIETPDLKLLGTCFSESIPELFHSKVRDPELDGGGLSYVYELRNALGIVWLAQHFEVRPFADSILNISRKTEAFWNERRLWIEESPPAQLGLIEKFKTYGLARDLVFQSQSLSFHSWADKPSFAVVALNYRKRFKALVNNQPTPVFRAMGGFMAIPVVAGRSYIVMSYDSSPIIYAGAIGLIVSLALAGLAATYPKKG